MTIGARKLPQWLAIPLKTQPSQTIENGGNRRLGGAFAISVFDAQQELAAGVAGVKPIEQRRAGATDVQEASGRWGKAGDDGIGHRENSRCDEGKIWL